MTATFSYQYVDAELDRPRLQENTRDGFGSVSYTHLTLPTTVIV